MNSVAKIMTPMLVSIALMSQARANEKVYKSTLPGTVWIINPTEEGIVTGSGALIDLKRKLVVTCEHVTHDSTEVLVIFPIYDGNHQVIAERSAYLEHARQLRRRGRLVKARVVARDANRDLALLALDHVAEDARALPLATKGASPGQRVHSIGNPGASDGLWLYTGGRVRQVYQESFKTEGNCLRRARVVETSSPVNPGDSGGPVVNDRGELVAIVESAHLGKEVRLMSECIDVSEVKELMQRYTKRGLSLHAGTVHERLQAGISQ